jgi:transposase
LSYVEEWSVAHRTTLEQRTGWRLGDKEMAHIIGHTAFLYVADCKAGALETRGTIDHAGGCYLFPLAMTGEVPTQMREWVFNPPVAPHELCLEGVTDAEGQPVAVGQGFEVTQQMEVRLPEGRHHTWEERWLITQSTAHAQRQQQALQERLGKAQARLGRLRIQPEESPAQFQARAERVIAHYPVEGLLSVTVVESVTHKKRYLRAGRPTSDTPYARVEQRRVDLHVRRHVTAIADYDLAFAQVRRTARHHTGAVTHDCVEEFILQSKY